MDPDALTAHLDDEGSLLAVALAAGASEVPGWSEAERLLAATARAGAHRRETVAACARAVRDGRDPLGEAFCRLRPADVRRGAGATYTPPVIVDAMLDWAAARRPPERVVDPGAGSGRFTVAAGRRFGRARLVAVENDPLASIVCRANIALAGLADRAAVIGADYLAGDAGAHEGSTLYVGNPPYVRHHDIPASWKEWLALTARSHGLEASRLAGLHVYFFLATLQRARTGDTGVFVTSSEWLDTNYGRLVRDLLLGPLGGESIHVMEPTVAPFEGAAVTAAITCFAVGGASATIRMRRVASTDDLGGLDTGDPVPRADLEATSRWTPLTRARRARPAGWIELGEICRVRRGAVTGRNATWVVRPGETDLPERVLFPCVTRAREIFQAGEALARADHLKLVVDLPRDLDDFDAAERRRIQRFLTRARAAGAHDGYIARTRPRVVVGRAARARADPGDVHGPPPPGVHPQHRGGAPHQHRPRAVPAGRPAARRPCGG